MIKKKVYAETTNFLILWWICMFLIKRRIDKIIKHNLPELKITFGSTLNKNPCDASFAIDDLIVYIKWKKIF